MEKSVEKRKKSQRNIRGPLIDFCSNFQFDGDEQIDTTLLLHFFGKNGRDTLNYNEFHRSVQHVLLDKKTLVLP